MNMAAVMKLAVIFICNNNAYAYSTPTALQYAIKDLSARGPAYGMPGVTIDGNDVLAVHATVKEAIERGRAGHGPSFIECKTFRLTGHSAHDAAEYVPKKVMDNEAKKDPIPRFEKYLLAKRLLTKERIREMERAMEKEIDDAVAFAESSPMPEAGTAVEGVCCEPDCWWDKAPSPKSGGSEVRRS
jgi:TPP-dependent pyruvate/acetoin dehydrogenase alpha subunit